MKQVGLSKTSAVLKVGIVLSFSWVLMGNKGCKEEPGAKVPAERELRRRVQLGLIDAPRIQLPTNLGFQEREFDFGFVANAQMAKVLKDTQSFSTATVDPDLVFSPEGLDASEQDEFYSCQAAEDLALANASLLQKATWTQDASCMINLPAGIINGSVLDFSFVNKKDVGLNFAGIPLLTSASFEFENYQLEVAMSVKAPLIKGNNAELATIQKADWKTKSQSVGLSLPLGPLSLGPRFYFTSTNNTLRKVVDEAFTSAVSDLKDQWNQQEKWYGMILKDCDRGIYLNAGRGADANLVKGDIVKLVNVLYVFEGPACGSFLRSDLALEEQIIAYARVESVGRNMSYARIIENDPLNYPVLRTCGSDGTCSGRPRLRPGARAYIEKMKK